MKKILLVLFALAALTACKNRKNYVPDETLLNTKWLLQTLNSEAVDTVESEGVKSVFLFLEEGTNQLNGFAGCNRFFGSYEELEDNGLKFSEVMSTKMGCDRLELEEKILLLLNQITRYEIKDNILYMMTDDGGAASFKASAIE